MKAIDCLRASKDRWGSYAIDHNAIDALVDLIEAVEQQEEPSHRLMDAYGALTSAIEQNYAPPPITKPARQRQ